MRCVSLELLGTVLVYDLVVMVVGTPCIVGAMGMALVCTSCIAEGVFLLACA